MNRKIAKKKSMTKNKTIVYALVALGGLLLVSAALLLFARQKNNPNPASIEGGVPRLAVDREQIDFGDVPVGQVVTASFELTNTGTSTLSFTGEPTVQLKAGC